MYAQRLQPSYQTHNFAERAGQATDRTPTAGNVLGSSPTSTQTLRYPVLEPLVPYIKRNLSLSLACDLLEAYVADTAEGVHSPSSPLLLAHISKRESILSHKPRKCTPALLASMLLVAAHTTVFPFFDASPTGELTLSALRKAELTLLTFVVARDRLQRSLLQLSLALMDKLPEARGRRSETQDSRINKPEVHDLPRSTAVR